MRQHPRRLCVERLLAQRPGRLEALFRVGANDVQKGARARFEIIAVSDQRAADQQYRVVAVVGAHPGNLLEAHAARRHGQVC